MHPETPQHINGSESLPTENLPGGERIPALPRPETGSERAPEPKEQASEAGAAASDMAATGQPVMPTIDPTLQAGSTPQTSDDTSPAIANDADVIEKEWVDSAKKIVEDTKGDPHARSAKASQLQKAYRKKRYGKELGISG